MNSRGQPEQAANSEYIERIQAYMAKALNEAKLNTSWIQPNEEWLGATRDFVAGILESSAKNKFLPSFLPVVEQIAPLGAINSLTQTLLKLTSPGAHIYVGNEIWDFSLVDPDNRRPVDYAWRQQMLQPLAGSRPEEILQSWPDGRIKMFLTQKLLRFRQERSELFRSGNYVPVAATGSLAESCVSFIREFEGRWILVIAPRLSARIGFPPIGQVRDTVLELPENLELKNACELSPIAKSHSR